jgi:hypothetical protein
VSIESDGGPAFPVGNETLHGGMSLLDYFAGQALAGLVSLDGAWTAAAMAKKKEGDFTAEMAVASYQIAHAMLEERRRLFGE